MKRVVSIIFLLLAAGVAFLGLMFLIAADGSSARMVVAGVLLVLAILMGGLAMRGVTVRAVEREPQSLLLARKECPYCGKQLPMNRAAESCPSCGGNLKLSSVTLKEDGSRFGL